MWAYPRLRGHVRVKIRLYGAESIEQPAASHL